MKDASSIEKFSRGEPIVVEVDRLERELAGLWKTASQASGREGAEPVAVSRAALWNVIIPAHGAESLRRIKAMVDELAPSIPARFILLCEDAGASDTIKATIDSNVVSNPGGARTVLSEEITLTGRAGVEDHFGALVRSLQIPSLPTATFWIDSTMAERLLTRELLPLSDRLVLDTGTCAARADLTNVDRIARLSRTEVTDLGWLRLASFRLLFAGLFDPPVGGRPLHAARLVTIQHRVENASAATLLAGWLARQLGWRPVGAADIRGAAGGTRFTFRTAGSGRPVEVDVVPAEGESGTSGIVALELCASQGQEGQAASDEVYSVHRTGGNHAELRIPIAPARSIKLDSRSDAELCGAALGPNGRDPLFRDALSTAAALCALVERKATG
jgi:glucose-6-phosphate dehydrogenase assembly protein OpcA